MFLRKIKKFIRKNVVYKDVELTPKGECFKNYCESILKQEVEGKIMAYEELLDYFRLMIAENFGMVLDREDTAEFILEAYKEIL